MRKIKKKTGPKTDKLTIKQERFVRRYTNSADKDTFLKVGASFEAATGVDRHSNYGKCGGYMMKRKAHVRAAIMEALEKVQITPMYQARRLQRLMEAKRGVWHNGMRVGEEEDNEVQHKALVTSLKLTDAIDNLENQLKQNDGINLSISPEMAERLMKIAAEMKAMREAHSAQVIPLIETSKDG